MAIRAGGGAGCSKPREEGGIGIRDLYEVHMASIVERASRAWAHDRIWARWIRLRYVKNLDFVDNITKIGDSVGWRVICNAK